VRTERLRVEMRDVAPPVVRVIDVPASSTLPEVHELLQSALGWTDSHLHQFVAGDVRFGTPDMDNELDEVDERSARLSDLPQRFVYRYDFGDGWVHDVAKLGPGAAEPGCVGGEGMCPPEDCGGPPGFEHLIDVLANPEHPEHADIKKWTGDQLVPFNRDAVDETVRRTVGEVPPSAQLILELAVDGVKLTPGGRLPRSFVRAVQSQRPQWSPLGQPASIEEDLPPLAELHDVLCRVGLLRMRNGVLSPVKAAGADLEVVRKLRTAFPQRSFTTMVAMRSVAVLISSGPQPIESLAAAVFPLLGYGWGHTDGRPMTVGDVKSTIHRLGNLLAALDQVELDLSVWQAGRAPHSLFHPVTRLAALMA
jgi:hypothetical protein